MDVKDKKHVKRVRKMVIGSSICAIILIVSTYAWFIGMKTVNLSSFDVKIAAIDGLSLSLNGSEWKETIDINKANHKTAGYANNTNSWGGVGLYPVSTVGIIDAAHSTLTMFEKGSLTASPGGYRLMASEIANDTTEKDGYVAFDLFIKNLSGNEYYSEMEPKNEEAIYLTTDSQVKIAEQGSQQPSTGIENSVRIAFAQIGRVVATTDTTKAEGLNIVTGITCKDTSTTGENPKPVVTGICSNRVAQIWEPNDTAHVWNARKWYETACVKRTGLDVTKTDSYSGECALVEDLKAYKTYAVSGVINYSDNVDVYDGTDYNGYNGSISSTATAGKLMSYDYFTDTEKNLTGMARPTFITLAPNSITKVRIYIYIEGQDIDNYDFASLGKKITVNFGFTKERFYDTDVSYSDTDTAELPSDVVKSNHTTTTTTTTKHDLPRASTSSVAAE